MIVPFAKRRAAHLRLGQRGERLAVRLLHELGLDVLDRNFRSLHGEVDIVAREDDVLAFIEVKTRHRQSYGRPAEAVNTAKRRRIIRTAKQYLKELGFPALVYRYDIVEVILERRTIRDIRYFRNAFTEEKRSGQSFPTMMPDE